MNIIPRCFSHMRTITCDIQMTILQIYGNIQQVNDSFDSKDPVHFNMEDQSGRYVIYLQVMVFLRT